MWIDNEGRIVDNENRNIVVLENIEHRIITQKNFINVPHEMRYVNGKIVWVYFTNPDEKIWLSIPRAVEEDGDLVEYRSHIPL